MHIFSCEAFAFASSLGMKELKHAVQVCHMCPPVSFLLHCFCCVSFGFALKP